MSEPDLRPRSWEHPWHSRLLLLGNSDIRQTTSLFPWSQTSLGGPSQVHSNCLLCFLSGPPKAGAREEKTQPSPPSRVTCQRLAGPGEVSQKPLETEQPGRNLLHHTAAIAQPELCTRQRSVPTDSCSALAGESSRQEVCVVLRAGDTAFRRASACKGAGNEAARGDVLLSIAEKALSQLGGGNAARSLSLRCVLRAYSFAQRGHSYCRYIKRSAQTSDSAGVQKLLIIITKNISHLCSQL